MNIFKNNQDKFEAITSLDNLFNAWKKLEREISFHDIWYDELSFKKFKFNLKKELLIIQADLLNGTYKMSPIVPIPFPKIGTDKIRQAFRIEVRDQVVWIAVCNILGPIIEPKMPAWSFGNRLFIPMWKEKIKTTSLSSYEDFVKEDKYTWKNGIFLNSSFKLLNPWHRSWPRFRHLLSVTIKKMANVSLDSNEEEYESSNTQVVDWMRLRYLNSGYFKTDKKTESYKGIKKQYSRSTQNKIYWSSIDIKQFYPHIVMRKLREALLENAEIKNHTDDQDNRLENLIITLTKFTIKNSDNLSEDTLKLMGLNDISEFNGLPTGLVVGGWLANVYLLNLDLKIQESLEREREIAHFRYVDDHTFISTSPIKLIKWIKSYSKELKDLNLSINLDKFGPECKIARFGSKRDSDAISIGEIIVNKDWPNDLFEDDISENDNKNQEFFYYLREISKECEIDPHYPSPLMTETLEKISQIGSLDLALLSTNEIEMVKKDLKTLIVVDFPEEEIKEHTRVSFASTLLSRLLLRSSIDYNKLTYLRNEWINKCNEIYEELILQVKSRRYEKNIEDNLINEIKNKSNHLKFQIANIPKLGINNWNMSTFDFEFEDSDLKNYVAKFNDTLNEGNQITKAISILYNEYTNKIFSESFRIYKLLIKAANKVPDKIKIWIRIIEFCILYHPNLISDSLSQIKHQPNLHSKEKKFIISQLCNVIALKLVNNGWNLLNNKILNAFEFQNFINNINFLTEIEFDDVSNESAYQKNASILYKIAVNFVNYCQNKNKVGSNDEYLYENLTKSHDDQIFEILWLIDNLSFEDQKKLNILSVFNLQFIRGEDIKDNSSLNNLLAKIVTSPIEYGDFHINFIENNLLKIMDRELQLIWQNRKEFKKETCIFDQNKSEYISLIELITLQNKLSNKILHKALDSEIVCLKILYAVICKFQQNDNLDKSILNIKYIDINVKDLCEIWKSDNPLEKDLGIQFNDTNSSSDNYMRFQQKIFIDYRSSVLYLLGIVLYQILSKDLHIEWLKYRPEYLYEWDAIINKLQIEGKIGSFSERILRGCLTPVTRELFLHQVTSENIKIVNFPYAPLFIANITDLKNKIEDHFHTSKEGIIRIKENNRIELKFIDLK